MTHPATSALERIADQFTTHRPRLYAIALRVLGSPWAADDALQDTWIRLQRSDIDKIENLEAWLTTVVSRVCIDLIRQQASWREELDATDEHTSETELHREPGPADAALRADDLALALGVILDQLGPRERLALVLHDVFAMPFGDIAPIVERSSSATRQLASRARARLREVDLDHARHQHTAAIDAFLRAARDGDFAGLLQVLDPEIEVRSDETAVRLTAAGAQDGAPLLDARVRGVDAVARIFVGRAALTRMVWIDGAPGAAYLYDGEVRAVYLITLHDNRITRMDILADSAALAAVQVNLP